MYASLTIHQSSPGFPAELNRAAYLLDQARGHSVLHVGCTDAPITAARIRDGQLLHLQLRKVARSIIGIDISTAGIALLEQAGCNDVLCHDAEQLNLGHRYECIVAGDVVEHLNNPGLFLTGAMRHLAPGGELIIGVPSALSFTVFKAWLGRETVHKDHTFYFSPKVLAELCARHGFLPTKLVFTVQPQSLGESSVYIWLRNTLVRWFPRVAPSMIMHFKRREEIVPGKVAVWR